MTESQLKAAFPPVEDVSKCTPRLVGGDAQLPPQIPGAEKKPRSQCARTYQIAGITTEDDADMDKWMEKAQDWCGRHGVDCGDYRAGYAYTFAQTRGAVRAGLLAEDALVAAAHEKSTTAHGAVGTVASALYNGCSEFSGAYTSRRQLAALVAESCDDLDPSRVRTYVEGGYSLSQIAADANTRVQYGSCRTQFLQGQKALAAKLIRRSGAFGGIGLARATRPDHKLDPDDASSFLVYSSRSKLAQSAARIGVILANAMPQVEAFWDGAIAVLPSSDAASDWRSAVVWIRDGRVSKILANAKSFDKLGDLPKTLSATYGTAGSGQGTVTKWTLTDGTPVTLDIGAAGYLLVGSVAPSAAPAPSASVSATASGATVPAAAAK
jgi:hypothetical protein